MTSADVQSGLALGILGGDGYANEFIGRNGAGSVTCTGTKVGQLVQLVTDLTDNSDGRAWFESVISVTDQIQQVNASNLSAKQFAVILTTFVSSATE